MSPVRKEDDFRSKHIDDWDDWIEKEIRESMERGEFTDLPDHGKPIRIESNAFDPSTDMAYSRLRNAGYAPTWMELDREITAGREALDQFLQRSGEVVASMTERMRDDDVPPQSGADADRPLSHPWWAGWAFWRRLQDWLDLADRPTETSSGALTITDLDQIRDRMRAQYLERSVELDKKIGTFHAALPPALWHLQRPTLPKERAAQLFDAHIPPRPR